MESIKYGARLKYWAWLVVALVLLFIGKISYAQNIGFESGDLSNWTTSGNDVIISTGLNNVTYGDNKYWTITPYGTYMAELYPNSNVSFDSTTASLGLNPAENTAIKNFMNANAGGGNPTPTNGAWIKRTVTLQAGVTYSFAWNYLSTDYTPFNDGSMITLVHKTNANVIPNLNNDQRRYALLGFTNPGTGNYSTDSYGSTGWQLAVFTVPESGEYELGFATFNLGDTALSPMLFIDELQGTTLLNGQPFAPIAPNPGSNAPVTGGNLSLCCGGSSQPFNSDTAFNNRVSGFITSNSDNRVIIQQIGNSGTISVAQSGKKNYVEIQSTGNNNITTNQTANGVNISNYIETTINSGGNTVTLTQTGDNGNKGIISTILNSGNNLNIIQTGSGSHYADIRLSGGSKVVDLTQTGSASHMSRIDLSGGATSITTVQQGSVQQFYSITYNCAQTSCATITVTQGQ